MINRKRIKPAADETEVNVTPLLDIVFIMLIFFIVTATFVYEDGFSPNLPEPNDEQDTNPPPALLLFVQEDGFVLVDDVRIIDPRSVKPVVEEFLASKPRGVVQITAALESDSGVAVTVLDQARQANRNAPIVIAKASE